MSLDGFVAGPNQRLDSPFGDIDENILHRWMFDHADQPEHKQKCLNILLMRERLFEGVPGLKLERLEVSGTKLVAQIRYNALR